MDEANCHIGTVANIDAVEASVLRNKQYSTIREREKYIQTPQVII